MLQKLVDLVGEYDMLPRGALVLCAVSGGKDSMCLLHLLCAQAAEGGFRLAAAHFNHHLRGAESDRDAAFVSRLCESWGIPCYMGSGDVGHAAQASARGLEETARDLRYAFLRQCAGEIGATRIATAHNADDNAETLLLHLVRGSGLQGLTGIPPRREEIVRPLLTIGRAEIESYLSQRNIPHVEDSSNSDETFSRNRLRAQVMPVLWALNPRFSEHISETIALLRADNDYLNAQAAQVCLAARWAEDDLVIEARHIADLPRAIAPRAVRRLLDRMGDGTVSCSAAHLNAVVDLAQGDDPSAVVFLPNGWQAQRIYKELLITTQTDSLPPLASQPLCLEGETVLLNSPWQISCRSAVCPAEQVPGVFYLDRAGLVGTPMIRARRVGDELRLPRRGGTKTVKKLMIDEKLPRRQREQVPILADEAGVLAVAGFGPNEDRLALPGAPAYEIAIVHNDSTKEIN